MLQRMDLDIGTLIYIIITLVVVITGALGKKRKPVTKPATGESSGSGGFFQKLEDQLSGFVDETKASLSSTESENDLEELNPETSFQQENNGNYQNEEEGTLYVDTSKSNEDAGLSDSYEDEEESEYEEIADLINNEAIRATDGNMIMEVYDLDNDLGLDYFDLVDDFDLKSAVIYSAIINRKEY